MSINQCILLDAIKQQESHYESNAVVKLIDRVQTAPHWCEC